MWTRRQFKVWTIAFALLVMSLLAALPVFADPGIRLGPPDAPATGYAPLAGAPAALPVTGAQPSTQPYNSVAQIPRVEALPHHTMFELKTLEQNLAAPKPQSSTRPWVTVAQIPRLSVSAGHSVAELRQVEASLARP